MTEMTKEERQKWIDEHPIRKMVMNMSSAEAEKKKERAKELKEQEIIEDG